MSLDDIIWPRSTFSLVSSERLASQLSKSQFELMLLSIDFNSVVRLLKSTLYLLEDRRWESEQGYSMVGFGGFDAIWLGMPDIEGFVGCCYCFCFCMPSRLLRNAGFLTWFYCWLPPLINGDILALNGLAPISEGFVLVL